MLETKICEIADCESPCVQFRSRCFSHLEEKESYLLDVKAFLEGSKSHTRLSLPGIVADCWDLSGKTFFMCNFSEAVFRNTVLTNCSFRLCFFDFVKMESCTALNLDAYNTVFAGTTLSNCNFEGSNLIQLNFNNSVCRNSQFNSSDLYNSRFRGAVLENDNFIDCNLKNVDFRKSRREAVNFKYSNLADAFVDKAAAP